MHGEGSVRALTLVFAVNGFLMAQVFARVPALRDQVDASTGRLGLALVAVGVGSMVAMPWTARLCSRFGSPPVVLASALLSAVGWAGLAWAPTPGALTAVFLVVGLGVGVWDVSMNVQGNTQERRHRRVLMPRLHAGFSAGSVAGALLGAACAAGGIGVTAQLPLMSGAAGLLVAVCVPRFARDAEVHDRERVAARTGEGPGGRKRSRPGGIELVLGVLTFATALGEGAANDWLALVLVDERGAPAAVGALTYAGFNVAMTAGRLGGGALIRRTGRVLVLRLAGTSAVTGVLLVALVPSLAAAMTGGLLWGLGLAVVFPATMSAAGELPGRGAQAIGVVSTIGYAGFLAGSPTIGLVAERTGLDLALLLVAGVCALVIVLAGSARERRGQPAESDTAARPASSRATGTRNGEQET
jgi:MFS family permease